MDGIHRLVGPKILFGTNCTAKDLLKACQQLYLFLNYTTMLKTFLNNWWLLVLKGVLLIVFGIIAMLNPGVTFTVMLIWFSAYLIIDGIFSLISVFRNWQTQEGKWLFVLEGALGIVLGILIYRSPESYALFAVLMMAFWAIFAGVSRIGMAIQLRKEIEGEGWLALSGVLSILFGIIIIAQPSIGVSTLVFIIAIFALIIGAALIMLGLRVRKVSEKVEAGVQQLKAR
jgi:uncharacterized membrane protein HdeD (DUF308 family)